MGILLQAATPITTAVVDTANAILPAATAPVKDLSVLELMAKGGFMICL